MTSAHDKKFDVKNIDNSWTLFIDRDGVINHEKADGYINTWEEFIFYQGATEAFEIFARKFKHIIIVTNQRGIGRGITKPEDLRLIHQNMEMEIRKNNGRVDAVYFCSDVEDTSPRRKPNAAMGFEAAKDFPGIDLSKSVMVGNRKSDMEFGRNLGVFTVYLSTTHPDNAAYKASIDAEYPSLLSFANDLI